LLWANICLRLSSSAHSPLTTGFELRHPRLEAKKTAENSPFWARKAAAGGDFLGAMYTAFRAIAIGHFSCAAGDFWLLANWAFLSALARSIAPTETFSPQNEVPKKQTKNERKNQFQRTQSRTLLNHSKQQPRLFKCCILSYTLT
jgi:hypothetical protein